MSDVRDAGMAIPYSFTLQKVPVEKVRQFSKSFARVRGKKPLT